MADRSLRGIRLGAQSLQSEEGVVFHERAQHTYTCTSCGRDTTMTFRRRRRGSPGVGVPHLWCGGAAAHRRGHRDRRPLRRQGRAQPLGHAARASHAPRARRAPRGAPRLRPRPPRRRRRGRTRQDQRLTLTHSTRRRFLREPASSRCGDPHRDHDAERDEDEKAPPAEERPGSRRPATTAGVRPVRSGTSRSAGGRPRPPAGRRSSCRRARSPDWCRRSRG